MEAENRSDLHEVSLTFAQQFLWMLDFIHPGQAFAPGFIVRTRHRIHGPLRPDVLRQGFDRVIARHGALRTTIEALGTMPFQKVHDAASIDLDLVEVDPGEPAEKFFTSHEIEERDVTVAPSIWARLGRIRGDEHLLSIVAHHAVCDAWSMGLILDDLAAQYQCILDGDAVEVPPPPDYRDFSILQQSRDDPNLSARLDYWADHLDGVTPGPLTIDHEREPGGPDAKRVERFVIDEELTSRVVTSVRRHRSTMFILLLAAYAAHLARRYGVRDLTVPTITSSRHRTETVGLVAYLNNVVPLRLVLDADPTLGEVLAVARRATLDAFANEVPMVLLADHVPDLGLLLSDDRAVTAPFQHVPYSTAPVKLGDCTCVPEDQDEPPQIMTMPVDLISTIGSDRDRLVGDICYTAGLFGPDTISDLTFGFLRMVRALVDDPAQRLSET
jgi:hypothetical protein